MKNWSKGDRVSQPTYGAGTLVEVNEHHTVIDFDEGGRKDVRDEARRAAGVERTGPAQDADAEAGGQEEEG